MRNSRVLIVYKSVTGFTREYAQMVAQEVNGMLIDLKRVTAETMSDFDTVVFGGRLHAGTIEGLKKAKKIFEKSKASRFLVYATGAAPKDATEVIEKMWQTNFIPEELRKIPHFYFPGGLRYEKMPAMDRLMMKAFASIMKRQKGKKEGQEEFVAAISGSYDISSEEYIAPLLEALGAGRKK